MSPPSAEHPIYISGITLHVEQASHKTVDHILLRTQTRGSKKEIQGKISPGGERKEVFDAPLELSTRDELYVSMQYQSQLLCIERTPHVTLAMKHSDIMKELQEGKRTYVKLCRKIVVTLDISSESAAAEVPHANDPGPSFFNRSYDIDAAPSPTTSEILRICPRFRLLIIGNTGVGKSSLIKDVFGVTDVLVSEASRGQAEISREFVSEKNGLFVLHDSLGLEAAEGDNLAKVKNFIRDRRQKQDLKDKLHAVWVCLPVPYAKGRLLEAGMEEFLRDRKDILGDIPIVVVLTKLDLLDNTFIIALRTGGAKFRTIKEAQPLLQPRRTQFLQEFCTEPLVRTVGDVPHVAVSTQKDYNLESTIPELVKKTTSEIERYILADLQHGVVSEQQTIERKAPLYIAGMAQRASIEENVDLTIEIGKNKYWANFRAGFRSPDTVKEYLLGMHHEIIQVWNFNDPERALENDEFKKALLDTSNLGVHDIPAGDEAPATSQLTPLITDPLLAVVTFPITRVITLVELCIEIFKSARNIVKRFMAYITDLIYVMRILFILAPHGSVTTRDVALAVRVYMKSTYRIHVHREVNDFSAVGAILPGGRDAVVVKIEELVRRYNITDEDVSRVRSESHIGSS